MAKGTASGHKNSAPIILCEMHFPATLFLNRHHFSREVHSVSKNGATKLMAVNSSNLNQFSKFFYHCKVKEIANKTHVSFPTTP